MSFERVFSEEELRIAGLRSVDALVDAIDTGDREQAARFGRRLRREVLSMIQNYDGWESTLTARILAREGEAATQQVLQEIEDPAVAPERGHPEEGLIERWLEEARQIAEDIGAGRDETAKTRARALHQHALERHDRGMSRVSALLSWIGRHHGDDALEEALFEAMASDMLGDAGFRERAEMLMHFTRVHLQAFELHEDEEKLTFLCPVCPSGGRLLRAGHYEAPRSDHVVEGPRPLTYGRESLPAYCCHEPVMEIASIKNTGEPLFIVDPSDDLGQKPCKTYLYKDPKKIPARFYERLGLTKP